MRNAGTIVAVLGVVGIAACAGHVDESTARSEDVASNQAAVSVTSTPGVAVWAKLFGDTDGTTNTQDITGLALDASGGEIVVGFFGDTIDLGGAQYAAPTIYRSQPFLASFDSYGHYRWSKTVSGSQDGTGFGKVVVDGDGNLVVMGGLAGTADFGAGPVTSTRQDHSDSILLKYSPDGTLLWMKQETGGGTFTAMATDPTTRDVVITGYLTNNATGPLIFSGCQATTSAANAMFLIRVDTNGNCRWVNSFDGGYPRDVALDPSGAAYVTGESSLPMDFHDGEGVHPSAGGSDVWLAKIDANANPIWSRRYGDAKYQFVSAIAVRNTRIALIGAYEGTMDFGNGKTITEGGAPPADVYLAKISTSTGNPVWVRTATGTDSAWPSAVKFDGYGNVIATGNFQGELRPDAASGLEYLENYGTFGSGPQTDAFVLKYDSYGNGLWDSSYGLGTFGPTQQYFATDPNALAISSSGRIVIGGQVAGDVDFGKGTMHPSGYDAFLVRFYQ